MVETVLASSHHSMLGSHRCSVHSLPLGLHRPFTTLFWDSRSLRGHSSGLWGSASSNKIPSLEKNSVNKQNRIHSRFRMDSLDDHLLGNSLHNLGYGLVPSRLSGAMVDIHTLIRCTMARGRLHRIPSRKKAELQTLHLVFPE